MAGKIALPNQPRPTMEALNALLAERGWTPSAGCWEDDGRVFCFAAESYPGTYGGAAASAVWSANGGWLVVDGSKPRGVRFV
jgi:hypothetical protein